MTTTWYSDETLATLTQAQPATDRLLESLLQAYRDMRDHDHGAGPDLYCLNLSSFIGERILPVLRRLADAERRPAYDPDFADRLTNGRPA